MENSKCPFHGSTTTPNLGTQNKDWWPNQLNLDILRQHDNKSNPLNELDYKQAVKELDLAAVKEDLKAFFDSIILIVREFATEIGKPNGYRTLYQVFNGNRDPSSKLVKSIIRRFPQLSYDWVFVGAGEMLTEGGDMMRSVHDHELTVQARFMQTMDRIEKIEFATNELANIKEYSI